MWLFEVLWGVTRIQLLVILSEAKNLGLQDQILRFAQNDKRVYPTFTEKSRECFLIINSLPHNTSKSLFFIDTANYLVASNNWLELEIKDNAIDLCACTIKKCKKALSAIVIFDIPVGGFRASLRLLPGSV